MRLINLSTFASRDNDARAPALHRPRYWYYAIVTCEQRDLIYNQLPVEY